MDSTSMKLSNTIFPIEETLKNSNNRGNMSIDDWMLTSRGTQRQEQIVSDMLSVKNLKKVFRDATEASSIEFV